MRQPRPQAAFALSALKAVGLGAGVALVVGLGAASTAQPDQPAPRRAPAVEPVLGASHCPPARADSTGSANALVKTPAGQLRVVSFATGWDMYTGRRPGTLVAVCGPGPS